MTREAYMATRTAFGRSGGALSAVRTYDLGPLPLAADGTQPKKVDSQAVTDLVLGCANQAGEDNRNVASVRAVGSLTACEDVPV